MRFTKFFSLDSPKAIKARAYGYMNAINYMAPAALAGVGNLCPHASPGCLALCLGWHSGQAGMVKGGRTNALNAVRRSRQDKARMFMRDGATDIAWEGATRDIRRDGVPHHSIFTAFRDVQFVDYTKSVRRALRAASDPTWPKNYHLTFSRSETNWNECVQVLTAGGNVAIVFADKNAALAAGLYRGFTVIDGDQHDLRHLDTGHGRDGGVIVALSPKGNRAKRDTSGFVIR